MRTLFWTFLGLIIGYFVFHSSGKGLLRNPRAIKPVGSQTSQPYSGEMLTKRGPGKYDEEHCRLFRLVFPKDEEIPYALPDSQNTSFYRLSRGDEEIILIQSSAGHGSGSCGWNIVAARIFSGQDSAVILVNECGVVDSVFHISHNGVMDFSIANKRGENKMRYQYNGEAFNAFPVPAQLSDKQKIEDVLQSETMYDARYDGGVQLEYVVLDSSAPPYIFAYHGLDGTFLFSENQPGKFTMINFFHHVVEIDIQSTLHYGMPDFIGLSTSYEYIRYRWNGREYIEHKRWPWSCPA